jgi:hypothetical protein
MTSSYVALERSESTTGLVQCIPNRWWRFPTFGMLMPPPGWGGALGWLANRNSC